MTFNLMDSKLILELAARLSEAGAKSVALQMPDDMLCDSADICIELSNLLNKETKSEEEEILVYVLADT